MGVGPAGVLSNQRDETIEPEKPSLMLREELQRNALRIESLFLSMSSFVVVPERTAALPTAMAATMRRAKLSNPQQSPVDNVPAPWSCVLRDDAPGKGILLANIAAPGGGVLRPELVLPLVDVPPLLNDIVAPGGDVLPPIDDAATPVLRLTDDVGPGKEVTLDDLFAPGRGGGVLTPGGGGGVLRLVFILCETKR